MKHNLVEYFKRNLKKGYTAQALTYSLVSQGYQRIFIEEALKQANLEMAKTAPILKEKPEIKHEVLDENDHLIKRPWWKFW